MSLSQNIKSKIILDFKGDSLIDHSGNQGPLQNISSAFLGVPNGYGLGAYKGATNGAGLQLAVSDEANLDMDTNDFAVEWIGSVANGASGCYFIVKSQDVSHNYYLNIVSSGAVSGRINSSGCGSFAGGAGFFNKLHHILWVVDRSGNGTVYVDGLPGTSQPADPSSCNNTGHFQIHNNGGACNTAFHNSIRVFKFGVNELTPALISQLLRETYSEYMANMQLGNVSIPVYDFSSIDKQQIVEPGLIAAWNMSRDRANNKVLDISYNGNDATIVSTVDGQGIMGQAMFFNGNGSNVNSTLQPSTSARTVICWIKPYSLTGGNRQIVTNGPQSQFYQAGANLRFAAIGGNPSVAVIVANQWQQVGYTYDGVNLQLYAHGLPVGNPTGCLITTGPTCVGAYQAANPLEGFLGGIDSVRIYNRALSAAEFAAQYNATAKMIAMNETFINNGADGIVKVPKGWITFSGTHKFASILAETEAPGILHKGDKYIQCATTGSIITQSDKSFGAWEFSFYKNGGTNTQIYFICQQPGTIGVATGWAIGAGANFNPSLILYNPGTNQKITTANNFIVTKTWYKFRVTRSLLGVFNFYIKGGTFGTTGWTFIGTYTDATTFPASSWVEVLLGAGDRFVGPKITYGVPI